MEHLYIIGGIIFVILILIIIYFFTKKTKDKNKENNLNNLKIALDAGDYNNNNPKITMYPNEPGINIKKENYMVNPQQYCKNMKYIFGEIGKIYKNIMGSDYIWNIDCSLVSTKQDTLGQLPNPEILFRPLIEIIKKGKDGYEDLVAIYIISIVNIKTMSGWEIMNNSEVSLKNNMFEIKLPTDWKNLDTLQICSPSSLISSIKDRKDTIHNDIIRNVKEEAEKYITYDDIKEFINDHNTEIKIDTLAKIILYSLAKEGMFPGIN